MKQIITILNSDSFGQVIPKHTEILETHFIVRREHVSSVHTLSAEAKKSVGLILGASTVIGDSELSQLPNLKIIARHGIGIDTIDLNETKKRSIIVTRIPSEYEMQSVAEHALGLLFILARQTNRAANAASKGLWNSRANYIGREIKNLQFGILGFGVIGKTVAQLLNGAFGSSCLFTDPKEALSKNNTHRSCSLEYLLTNSDALFLCCDLNPSSQRIINSKTLDLMKSNSFLINTSRGELIDEGSICNAIDAGKLSGYATDVLAKEPPDTNHLFFSRENIIVVPHIAAYTHETLERMGDTVVSQVVDFLIHQKIPDSIVT